MTTKTTLTVTITTKTPARIPKITPKFGLLSSEPDCLSTIFTDGFNVKFTLTGERGVVVSVTEGEAIRKRRKQLMTNIIGYSIVYRGENSY